MENDDDARYESATDQDGVPRHEEPVSRGDAKNLSNLVITAVGGIALSVAGFHFWSIVVIAVGVMGTLLMDSVRRWRQ